MKFLKNVKTDEFMATVTRTASKYGYKLKKASPTIMIFGAAIVGVAATVSACKATVKAQDILEDHNEMVKAIHETKEKVDMDPKYIITLTVTLFVTCVIVAGLLGLVNGVTKGPIAEINWQNTQTAMTQVVSDPDNTTFAETPLENTQAMTDAASAAGGTLGAIYEAQVNGETVGYAVTVSASGSQGTIEMMVGVDTEGTATGVSIISHSETSGIGTKVMGNEPTASGVGVLDQFVGKSAADGTLSVGTNVDAITGATVSTRGVTSGVNAALAAIGAMG